jgi:hypothetical protein
MVCSGTDLMLLLYICYLEGKIPLGRARGRWENGMIMDLKEIDCRVEWTQLAQGSDRCRALVNSVMNLRVLAARSWLVCYT